MNRDNKVCGIALSAADQCNALAVVLMRSWLLTLAWPRVVDVMVCNWWRTSTAKGLK